MHEMALAEGILGVVLDAAEGETVRRVRLRIGALQRVVLDSLQFCFQLAAQDTPAAEALLELEEMPARLRCRRCGLESEFQAPAFDCRQCGASDVEVVSGQEVLIDAVELESGWRHRPDANRAAAVEISPEHLREHAMADLDRHEAAGSA